MVGVAGFEPTASSSRTKRATKLRHTPRPQTRTGNIRLSAVLARTYFSPTLSQNAKRLLNGLWGQVAVSVAPDELRTTDNEPHPTNYGLRTGNYESRSTTSIKVADGRQNKRTGA